MSDPSKQIYNAIKNTNFLNRTVPALVEWGVKDEAVMVHSLGVSAWNTLGHELNFQAVAECPAPPGIGDVIRSDSVWFDKENHKPAVLIEFERYDGTIHSKNKLRDKVANLVEASFRWQAESALIILVAWNTDIVSAPDFQGLCLQIKQGSKNNTGYVVPGRNPRTFVLCRFQMHTRVDSKLQLDIQKIQFQEGE